MSLAFGFALPHWQAISGGAFNPVSLFQGGVNGAFYDPSDLTTLFTSSAGTTQCAMPGQGSAVSVGAILDERALGYSVYFSGSTNSTLTAPNSTNFTLDGDFTVEFWVYNTNVGGSPSYFTIGDSRSAQNGLLVYYSAVTSNLKVYSNSTTLIDGGALSNNQWLHVAVVRSGAGSNNLRLYVNGTTIGQVTNNTTFTGVAANGVVIAAEYAGSYGSYGRFYMSNFRIVKGAAVYAGNFTPPTAPLSPISGTSLLTCGTTWSGNPTITKSGDARIDGLNPFTASPVGNHAIAFNDTTARPELRARVNLLTYSEQFDNAAWSKFNTTVTANTTVAPDGTTTADSVFETTTNAGHSVYQIYASASGITYTISLYLKANGRNFAFLRVTDANTHAVSIDFVNKTAVNAFGTTTNISCTEVANGFLRVSFTFVSSGTGGIECSVISSTDGVYANRSYAGDVTKGFIAWGADVRPANIAANVPAYQRIADANTYDTSGFPLYLLFEGAVGQRGMYTPANLNLSGTDKATVFAGVRKLSDAAIGVLTEFTADINGNNGSFIVTAPSGAGDANYLFGSKGTIRVDATGTATFAASVGSVVCGIGDIAGDVATLRVNGSQNATNAANQGTGNYANAALYIGARNNASIWFNGQIYSLIIVGSAVSAGNISATDQWVAGKTGITI